MAFTALLYFVFLNTPQRSVSKTSPMDKAEMFLTYQSDREDDVRRRTNSI